MTTLWQVLGDYAVTFARWGRSFERAIAQLSAQDAIVSASALTDQQLSGLFDFNKPFLGEARRLCTVLELTAAEKHLFRLESALAGQSGSVTWNEVKELFDRLRLQIEDDLGDRLFFYVRPDDARAYAQPPPPWDRVAQAFPSAYQDIVCAWRCLALDQPTACVFHAMRVAEKGLQHLARATKTKIGKHADEENWARLIQAIEANAKLLPRGSNSAKSTRDRRRFLVDVLATFDLIKDAWRDHAMHSRVMYDAPRARMIMIAVGNAMSQLSEHYHEKPVPQTGRLTVETAFQREQKRRLSALNWPAESASDQAT